MSMIGNYKCIRPEELDDLIQNIRFRDDPDAVDRFLDPRRHSETARYDHSDPELNIGKSWHGIHFLLNGEKWGGKPPLFDVVLGGKEIGGDVGYGPARYLTIAQVRAVSNALTGLNQTQLRARFKPSEFAAAEIYPQCWDDARADRDFAWLWENLAAVRNLFQQAVQYGDAMLLYIN